jgi:hypothetical protein
MRFSELDPDPIRCIKAVRKLGDDRWRVWFQGGGSTNRARLIAAIKLGRTLTESEIVHHRNGDPSDDSFGNLEVFASSAAHLRRHLSEGDLGHRGVPHTPIKKRGRSIVAINLRIDPDLKDRLRVAGKENGRSFNAEVEYRLERSLESSYRR